MKRLGFFCCFGVGLFCFGFVGFGCFFGGFALFFFQYFHSAACDPHFSVIFSICFVCSFGVPASSPCLHHFSNVITNDWEGTSITSYVLKGNFSISDCIWGAEEWLKTTIDSMSKQIIEECKLTSKMPSWQGRWQDSKTFMENWEK